MAPWFEGNINGAVQAATSRNVVFLAFIHDDSEESTQMRDNIVTSAEATAIIQSNTVALQMHMTSQEAELFGQLFPIVKVPCIYLIRSGSVLDLIQHPITQDELVSRIQRAVAREIRDQPLIPINTPSMTTNLPDDEASNTPLPPEAIIGRATNDFPTRREENAASPAVTDVAAGPSSPNDSRQKVIEEQRKQREQQAKKEHEEQLEKARRESSKALLQAKKDDVDRKEKYRMEKLQRERQEAEKYRQQIREQVALDKAERQAHRKAETEVTQVATAEDASQASTSKTVISHEYSNLSIRLTDGSTLRNRFPSTETLASVREWLEQNRTDGDTPFILLQTFPHHQFTAHDEILTLRDLGLCPGGTLICKPAQSVSTAYADKSGGWGLVGHSLSLVESFLSYVNPFGSLSTSTATSSSSTENVGEQDQQSSGSSSKPNRRPLGSNVRTLQHDNNDERVTYNGNSTNQE